VGEPPGGHLASNVEGLSIYAPPGGGPDDGFLPASGQGNHTYVVYDRAPPHAYRGTFRVGEAGAVDGIEDTDGLHVVSAPLGLRARREPARGVEVLGGDPDMVATVADSLDLDHEYRSTSSSRMARLVGSPIARYTSTKPVQGKCPLACQLLPACRWPSPASESRSFSWSVDAG